MIVKIEKIRTIQNINHKWGQIKYPDQIFDLTPFVTIYFSVSWVVRAIAAILTASSRSFGDNNIAEGSVLTGAQS